MTREEQIAYVFKNRNILITEKTNTLKCADVVYHTRIENDTTNGVNKAGVDITVEDPSILNAKLVINTTNLIDSHMDCHISGLWKKSLSEAKQILLLKEHRMNFQQIIADSLVDKLDVSTKTVSFKSLGFNYDGNTEALIFDVQIKKDVNAEMFELYRKGRVTQHSVGMRYIKMFLCIDSNEANYSSEKANWDKYYPMVANKEVADQKGFFWAVTEAKVIEGSAVVKGSNECTPVMEIEIEKENTEAVINTLENEPLKDTQKANNSLSYY
jgi:hypothetical protein